MAITGQQQNPMRPQGVQPTNLRSPTAPAKTIVNCAKMELFAVEMGDPKGNRVVTVLARVGNMLYIDPNGERWASTLRPVDEKSWLYEQFVARMGSQEASTEKAAIPQQAVNVFDSITP